jgi:hypothetical protein
MNDMEKAYQLAGRAVRQRFAEQHPENLQVLNNLDRGDVAVYSGSYDSVEEVLRRLSLPFTLNPDPKKLSALILFVNCSSQPNDKLVRRLEPFVREGGWLVSSDWCLQHTVQVAFPDTVRKKEGAITGDEVVAVEPALDSLWSEVVVLGADPQWWLEGSSYPIETVDDQRVRVEAASHELLVRYGAPAVAVRFDWDRGQVFHVISHFWLKRSRALRERYQVPCTEFLKVGMRLSDEGVQKAMSQAQVKAEDLNFATIQSAATSTELIAQLCIRASRARAALQT